MAEIELIELTDQPVLCIRTRTRVEDLPALIGESYHKLMQYLTELGTGPADAPYTAYFNMDMQDLDVELGFPVDQVYPGRGDIQSIRMVAGKAVACLHHGSYSEMTQTYDAMNRWIGERGLVPTGAAYEYYLTGPEVPESDHLTRIVLPLK